MEKLKKKVENDPSSKLFVPLAEEYRKLGRIDEAINILLNGLKTQPDYMSAVVALGKMYLEKSMTAEAQEAFEKVVNVIPNNLFAHKRLAEMYFEHGEKDRAARECEIILSLSHNDEDAETMLGFLKPRKPDTEKPEKGAVSQIEETVHKNTDEILPVKEPPVYEISDEISGVDLGIEIPEKLTPSEDEVESEEMEEFKKIANQTKSEDRITLSLSTKTMADIYISQELYYKAVDIYREILSSDPENREIIQRQEELKMLIKLSDEKNKNIQQADQSSAGDNIT